MSDSDEDEAQHPPCDPVRLHYDPETGVEGALPCDIVTDLSDLNKVCLPIFTSATSGFTANLTGDNNDPGLQDIHGKKQARPNQGCCE
jgi:hypothetical protein